MDTLLLQGKAESALRRAQTICTSHLHSPAETQRAAERAEVEAGLSRAGIQEETRAGRTEQGRDPRRGQQASSRLSPREPQCRGTMAQTSGSRQTSELPPQIAPHKRQESSPSKNQHGPGAPTRLRGQHLQHQNPTTARGQGRPWPPSAERTRIRQGTWERSQGHRSTVTLPLLCPKDRQTPPRDGTQLQGPARRSLLLTASTSPLPSSLGATHWHKGRGSCRIRELDTHQSHQRCQSHPALALSLKASPSRRDDSSRFRRISLWHAEGPSSGRAWGMGTGGQGTSTGWWQGVTMGF